MIKNFEKARWLSRKTCCKSTNPKPDPTQEIMIKNIFRLIIIQCCFVLFYSVAESNDSGWYYSVKKNVEKTKRTYLLVANNFEGKKAKQFTVVSKCQRFLLSEGDISCTHHIYSHSSKKTFTIKTGVDVVLVRPVWDAPVILGTLGYGCCGAPDGVAFYTEYGKYLGGIDVEDRKSPSPYIFTEAYDFNNSVYDDKDGLIAVEDDDNPNIYYAWVKSGMKNIKRVPILFSIPNRNNCVFWILTAFDGTKMDFLGRNCRLKDEFGRDEVSLGDQKISFECDRDKKAFNCYPHKSPNNP